MRRNHRLDHLSQSLDAMPPHTRLDECCKLMYFDGHYSSFKPKGLMDSTIVLDSTNYFSGVVDDPLPLTKLMALVDIKPGYSTVLGEYETGDVIRSLEAMRVRKSVEIHRLISIAAAEHNISNTICSTTSGATGGGISSVNCSAGSGSGKQPNAAKKSCF